MTSTELLLTSMILSVDFHINAFNHKVESNITSKRIIKTVVCNSYSSRLLFNKKESPLRTVCNF